MPNDAQDVSDMKKMLHELMRNQPIKPMPVPPMMLVTVRFKVGEREIKPLAIQQGDLAVGHSVRIEGKTYTVRQFHWREEEGVLHLDHVELADSLAAMEDSLERR